jgi:hypothetical protein
LPFIPTPKAGALRQVSVNPRQKESLWLNPRNGNSDICYVRDTYFYPLINNRNFPCKGIDKSLPYV